MCVLRMAKDLTESRLCRGWRGPRVGRARRVKGLSLRHGLLVLAALLPYPRGGAAVLGGGVWSGAHALWPLSWHGSPLLQLRPHVPSSSPYRA